MARRQYATLSVEGAVAESGHASLCHGGGAHSSLCCGAVVTRPPPGSTVLIWREAKLAERVSANIRSRIVSLHL
jgi:hypothetical protein